MCDKTARPCPRCGYRTKKCPKCGEEIPVDVEPAWLYPVQPYPIPYPTPWPPWHEPYRITWTTEG